MDRARPIATPLQTSHDFNDAENDQPGSLTEGLTGTLRSTLNNPVLPSEFHLPAETAASKDKWEFMNRNRVPFAKGWRGLRVQSTQSIAL
jgi:hypothetical protein